MSRAVGTLVSVAAWIGALAAPAAADRDTGDARVDWAAGWVIATGVGIADRHAPSPAVALSTSRRGAEDVARQRIAAKLGSLPLAAGGTLASKLSDPAIKARIDAAVEAAISVSAEPETDGSWRVALAVPLEAIRVAIAGARKLPHAGDDGAAVVVVDGVTARPAICWTIAGIEAATLWVKSVPVWASHAPHVTARKAHGNTIDLATVPGSAATLYVIVTRS